MGGVETFTQSMARELAKRGHAVTVVTSGLDGSPEREVAPEGIEVLRLESFDPTGRFPLPKRTAHNRALQRELGKRPFDAVVVNTRFYPLSLIAMDVARDHGLRPVLIEHGSGYLRAGNPAVDAALHVYEHAIAHHIRAVNPICCGVSHEAGAWLSAFGLEAQGTVHNSIDATGFRAQASSRNFREEFHLSEYERIVAFSGRLIPEKGIWTFTGLARLLEGTGLRFFLAGDGPAIDELRDVRPADMEVLGRLSRADMAALLLDADMFCFPSEYPEGLPTSLLEAAACEAFIVTAPVAGAREIVSDASFGYVAQSADVHLLAHAILDSLEDESALRDRARRCRERVEREFSWVKAADDLLAICGCAR